MSKAFAELPESQEPTAQRYADLGAGDMQKSEVPWLVVLLVPSIFVLIWHLNNRAWPQDDAANYMYTAYQQYLSFTNDSILHALRSLYLVRGWRPVLLPVLATPFLVASHGNILVAAVASLCTAYTGLTAYTYALARRYLSPPLAATAAVATVTLPGFAAFSLVFFTEIWWLFFSLAWVFHALASDGFARRSHSLLAGAFLGLAETIRPAETTLIMAFPVIYFSVFAPRGKISYLELATDLGLSLAVGSILIISTFDTHLHRGAILACGGVLILLAWIIARRARARLLFASALTGICLTWWAGFMPALYAWVYTTSFGAMARTMDNPLERGSLMAILDRAFRNYTGGQIIALALLALIPVISAWSRQSWQPVDRPGSTRDLGLLAAAMLLAIGIVHALSGTSDPRRPIVAACVVSLYLAILALRPGPLIWLRWAGTCGVVTINLTGLLCASWGPLPLPPDFARTFDLYLPASHFKKDLDPAVMDQLLALGVRRTDKVAVYTLALFQSSARVYEFQSSARVYEPAALDLAALTRGWQNHVGYLWDDGDYDSALRRLAQQGYRFLLLDLYDGPGARSTHVPYVVFAVKLLDDVEHGAVSPPGLQRKSEFSLGGRDHILFEIVPPRGDLLNHSGSSESPSDGTAFRLGGLASGSIGRRQAPAISCSRCKGCS